KLERVANPNGLNPTARNHHPLPIIRVGKGLELAVIRRSVPEWRTQRDLTIVRGVCDIVVDDLTNELTLVFQLHKDDGRRSRRTMAAKKPRTIQSYLAECRRGSRWTASSLPLSRQCRTREQPTR